MYTPIFPQLPYDWDWVYTGGMGVDFNMRYLRRMSAPIVPFHDAPYNPQIDDFSAFLVSRGGE